MMKQINRILIIAVVVLFFCTATKSFAQETKAVSPGVAGFHDDFSLDVLDSVKSYLHQDRSYECALIVREYNDDAMTEEDYLIFNTAVTAPGGGMVTATANGTVFPQMSLPTPLNPAVTISTSQHARLRVALTAAATGLHTFTFSQPFGTSTESSTIRCRETTLYGSYNRFFAGTAIVEIESKASVSVVANITIIDSGGTTVVDKQEVTVNPNTRTDVIFASLPASNFGQILITHSAPFGTLSGVVAEYDFESDGSITLKRERPLRAAQRS